MMMKNKYFEFKLATVLRDKKKIIYQQIKVH